MNENSRLRKHKTKEREMIMPCVMDRADRRIAMLVKSKQKRFYHYN